MRIVPFIISFLATIALIMVFDTRLVLKGPLGSLLSPQQGVWQNAEPADMNYGEDLSFTALKAKTDIYFDDRLVPHIFAENEEDAWFAQGYLHARFRLWQMEFQTLAAAGRISEVLGPRLGTTNLLEKVDRYYRRLGMGYAAEKSLQLIESDPATKSMCDAYTAGVNAYIINLPEGQLPLEYKLLGYKPELWTNLKTALFIKNMAYDLAGRENDFEYTAARNVLSSIEFNLLNPLRQDSLDPVIPHDSAFTPGIRPQMPASADSLYFTFNRDSARLPAEPARPDPANGSNNWAVSGRKTKSGYPILCNDPHLSLNLPSVWFEMQIETPAFNVYGVSFPCAPGIIIGFNDHCAFGVTNAGRDVRDYYSVQFKDSTRTSYLYNGEWKATEFRYEHIRIKDEPDFIDTVAYTIWGPVLFEPRYPGQSKGDGSHAVRWKAHDPSNEVKMFQLLDRAKDYNEYLEAIKNLHTPGQNCAFACKDGDIALWCQGEFPAKWKRQGDFIMPGTDSSYAWQGMIPQAENPHVRNPERGFVSSANQIPTDTTYPYYLGGSFPNYRAISINRRLNALQNITPQDMMQLQTDNFNVFAEMARPVLLKHMPESSLNDEEMKYWNILKIWNLRNDTAERGPAVFTTVWDSLEQTVWSDDAAATHSQWWPYASTLLEGLLHDTSGTTFRFVDNINTPEKETLADDLLIALRKAVPVLRKADAEGRLAWAKFKDTRLQHLTRLPALSTLHLPIGGGTHVINAARADHGPSWRMVVSLTPQTEAWGVYPGGQSGNPGSRYYDSFTGSWANGNYYPLWVMKKEEAADKRVKFKTTMTKGSSIN